MKSLWILLAVVFSLQVHAEDKTFKVNPETLRSRLLETNIPLQMGYNQLNQAKERVNLSRANLLPSLSIGYTADVTGGFSFLNSTVSALLPFLVPSNWFDLRKSKHMLDAEKQAYYLLQLNSYASIYSLYITTVGDMETRDVLFEHWQNLKRVQNIVNEKFKLGLVSAGALAEATANAQLAEFDVSKLDQVIQQEKTALKKSLALTLTDEVVVEREHVLELDEEQIDVNKLLSLIQERAPEKRQLSALMSAAKSDKWSKIFGFISTGTLNSISRSGTESSSFNDITMGVGVNFGFGYFTAIKMSNLQRKQIELRQRELSLEQNVLAEDLKNILRESAERLDLAQLAEENLDKVIRDVREGYEIGVYDYLYLLLTENSVTRARMNRIQSRVSLDTVRINFQRALIMDQFSLIKGCRYDAKSKAKDLDKACR